MKQLQNNFTSPEQSKRLLELGLPADSADCYHNDFGGKGYIHLFGPGYSSYSDYRSYHSDDVIPCWSVGRLIEIENICSIPKIKKAGFHLLAQDFDDLIETMIISIKMKVEHNWMDFSKLED